MPCNRFEREGLLLLERGEQLGAHFSECETCRAEAAVYARLGEELHCAGEGRRPSPGWEQGVWRRIIAPAADVRKRRTWFWLFLPAAATAGLLLFLPLQPFAPSSPRLELRIVAGTGAVLRGESPQPGDRLLVEVRTGGAPYTEVRLYAGDAKLLVRCSAELPCRRHGDRIELEYVLPAVGTYQVVLLSGAAPFPPPSNRLDADAAAAQESGAHVEIRDLEVW